MDSIMVRLKHSQLKCAATVLIALALTACSTAPTQTIIAKNEAGSSLNESNRYQTKAIELPAAAQSFLTMGTEAYQAGNYAQALQFFERAQRMVPNYSRTYLLMGRVHEAQSNEVKAKQMYQRASALATNDRDRREADQAISGVSVAWP